MRLTRLYTPDIILDADRTVALDGDQSHYLLRVLRLGAGDAVALFNETGGAWQGIVTVDGKKAAVTLQQQIQQPQTARDVWLLLSPLKKEAWDFALEKATELGVGTIRPVTMEYTQNARINDERAQANIIEATQQCERTSPPHYETAITFDKLINGWDESRILYVALERSDAQAASEVFAAKADKAAILIGPEGGFSPREREILLSKKYVVPISLGENVLRAETAVVSALALYLI